MKEGKKTRTVAKVICFGTYTIEKDMTRENGRYALYRRGYWTDTKTISKRIRKRFDTFYEAMQELTTTVGAYVTID